MVDGGTNAFARVQYNALCSIELLLRFQVGILSEVISFASLSLPRDPDVNEGFGEGLVWFMDTRACLKDTYSYSLNRNKLI